MPLERGRPQLNTVATKARACSALGFGRDDMGARHAGGPAYRPCARARMLRSFGGSPAGNEVIRAPRVRRGMGVVWRVLCTGSSGLGACCRAARAAVARAVGVVLRGVRVRRAYGFGGDKGVRATAGGRAPQRARG